MAKTGKPKTKPSEAKLKPIKKIASNTKQSEVNPKPVAAKEIVERNKLPKMNLKPATAANKEELKYTKRARKPNLRYVNEEAVAERPDKKPVTTTAEEKTDTQTVDEKGVTPTQGNKTCKKRRKGKKICYKINCSDIRMDIADFRNYLQDHIKFAGKANNPLIGVKVRSSTVVVKCGVYVSKQSLRFLTKKYLGKQKLSVRVAADTQNSYKLISQ